MKRMACLLANSLMSALVCAQVSQSIQQTPPKTTQQQWVKASLGNNSLVAEQGRGLPHQQGQQAFPPSANAQATNSTPSVQNGMALMPPLVPPSNYDRATQIVSPFTNNEVVKLRKQLDALRKAKAFRPVRTTPRISSVSVDLSPGAAPPIVRVLPGEISTLVFIDATGAPWPLAASPRVSDTRYFDAEWLEGSQIVVVSALSTYEEGNLAIFLQGMAIPVAVKLVSAETDTKAKNRVVDYRLDLRLPGRGPNAQAFFLGPGKIALYDDVMQSFLDGLPPKEAKLVVAHGAVPARTQIWQFDGSLFIRTLHDIQNAFDQSMASGDGTRVYRLPPTPYITLSDMGRSLTLQLDIN